MRTFRRIACVVLLCIIGLSLYLTPVFGNRLLVIVSGSMEPAINTNALVLCHMCTTDEIEVGDITTYYHPIMEELITHRCIAKNGNLILTQGDANAVADSILVDDETIYGKVIHVFNFTAPIVSHFTKDRAFDRSSVLSLILAVGLTFCGISIIVSLLTTYGVAIYRVLHKQPYDTENLERANKRFLVLLKDPSSLSFGQRVLLQRLYTSWAEDMTTVDIKLPIKEETYDTPDDN